MQQTTLVGYNLPSGLTFSWILLAIFILLRKTTSLSSMKQFRGDAFIGLHHDVSATAGSG